MHRQFPDVPSWEEKRANHIGIGRKGDALARPVDGESRRIIHRIEQRIGESGGNDTFNQIVGRFAAAAMTERDLLVAQIELMTTSLLRAFDFLQDVINA